MVIWKSRHTYDVYCFFFQAEDGIRDLYVTGVQTCALPIWRIAAIEADHEDAASGIGLLAQAQRFFAVHGGRLLDEDVDTGLERSEERRVGKECRSRWSPYQ